MRMRGDDADFVAVVAGEMGVYEYEDVGESCGEGEGGGEEDPGGGVGVEDYC